MKETDKKKPIKTVPKGVWEASRGKKNRHTTDQTLDFQGNGYMPPKQGK